MRRALGDVFLSTIAVATLLIALVAIDERVRLQVAELIDAQTSTSVKDVSANLGDVVEVVATAVRDQGIEHATLVIFVLAATVLVLFMVRT
jgi:hypothetical protein